MGRIRQPSPPARFSASPSEPGREIPTRGHHTETILAELGHDDASIARLRADGVIDAD